MPFIDDAHLLHLGQSGFTRMFDEALVLPEECAGHSCRDHQRIEENTACIGRQQQRHRQQCGSDQSGHGCASSRQRNQQQQIHAQQAIAQVVGFAEGGGLFVVGGGAFVCCALEIACMKPVTDTLQCDACGAHDCQNLQQRTVDAVDCGRDRCYQQAAE